MSDSGKRPQIRRRWVRKGRRGAKLIPSMAQSPGAMGIFELFIKPLVKALRWAMKEADGELPTHKEALDILFGAKHRDVLSYRVRSPFRLPGAYMAGPNQYAQGYGNRDLVEGQRLLIRTDTRTPTIVDIEVFKSDWEEPDSELFRLTNFEYDVILKYLECIDPADRKEY